jgi:hypothetical protein
MAVLATCFLIGPMVVTRAWREKSLRHAATALAAGVLALGLAAIYLAPALSLQKYLSTSILWGPLYKPSAWSVINPGPGIPTGVLYTFATLAAGAALLALSAGLRFWTVLTLSVATASLGLPPVFWTLPVLTQVQFPWRAIEIVEFAAVTAFMTGPKRRLLIVAALAITLPGMIRLAEAAKHGFANAYPADIDTALPDAPEYLPPSFHAPGVVNYEARPDFRPYAGPLVRGAASGVTLRQDGTVSLEATAPGPIVIRRATFPAWQVTHNEAPVTLKPGTLIAFDAEPGRYELKRIVLPAEVIGGWISAGSALGLAGFTIWMFRRRTRPAQAALPDRP